MNIIRSPHQNTLGCHLLIGNYDGVHLGHQSIIKKAKKNAIKDKLPLVCLIFKPHPKIFFGVPHQPIQTLYDQCLTLQAYGIDRLFIVHFNQEVANLPAETFINNYLKPIRPKCIYIGEDFRFGKDRHGDTNMLKKVFDVHISKLKTINNIKISSTHCRKLLYEGDLPSLENYLGRPFHISGIVKKGQQLGRQLGYPTANLHADSHPLAGIYAATTILPDRRFIPSAVSIGYRPFKPINHGLLESFLIDFNENLYGQRLFVVFHKKIRDQKTFKETKTLISQMDNDLADIKQFFKENITYVPYLR